MSKKLSTPSTDINESLRDALMWVKDAPLFIDEIGIARFYDAIIRPNFEESETREIEIAEEQRSSLERRFGLQAGMRTPSWLAGLISGGLDAGIDAQKGSRDAQTSTRKLLLKSITTPERQLEQLLAFFLLNFDDRLLAGEPGDALKWQDQGINKQAPKAVVLIDVPARGQLIPMAAEFTNGRVSTFFDKLVKPSGERPPLEQGETRALWSWLQANFDPHQAMDLIEQAAIAQHSRIEWIDYRLPLDSEGATMHVHMEANGSYHTGNFAYRLIRRCYGHGMRMVGVLKDGPDINVLALYEK